jgi:autotransporter strand-loop-strand O-heptosyltransferase
MLKVLFITPHLSTGGLPQYLLTKIQAIHKEYDVHVCEWSDIAPIYTVQKDKIRDIIPERNFLSFPSNTQDDIKEGKLLSYIHDNGIDIIHFEEFPETFLRQSFLKQIYLTSDRQYRIVETTHDSAFTPDRKLFLPDFFMFVSHYHKSLFSEMAIPSMVVEYPIPDNQRPDRDSELESLGLDPNKKHVLNVGLFTPGKNQAEVFEIANKLKGNPIQFHFVGNQAMNFQEYWEPLTKDVADNCKIWGERSDVDKFYGCMDLLLFTSTSELNPLVPREALSWKMDVMMNNLPIYNNEYNGQVTYLSDNIDRNCANLLKTLRIPTIGMPKPMLKRKVKLVHLLTRPEDEREQKSVESLSPLKNYGIDYIQHINEPCTEYPIDWEPISEHHEKKPGYYGAYQAFRGAIEKEFSDDVDFLIVCECDCVLTIGHEDFITALNESFIAIEKNHIYYFSFGATGNDDVTWSENMGDINENMMLTNKVILAHCIMFPKKARDFLYKQYKTLGWDSPDIWMNHAFMDQKPIGIIKRYITRQYEGYSLIDNEWKGTLQADEESMSDKIDGIYSSTSISIKESKPSFTFDFANGAYLSVNGISKFHNNVHKNIFGDFDFEPIYRYVVDNINDAHIVEVGAWMGKSTSFMAKEIKDSGKNIIFDVVDTWKGTVNEKDHQEIVKEHGGSIYKVFKKNMTDAGLDGYHNPKIMTSNKAYRRYDDESLDFVFLDSDHSYKSVNKDIEKWYPKIKPGCIIAGHDWIDPFPGVKQAVREQFGIDYIIYHNSWIHVKGKDNHFTEKYKNMSFEEYDNTYTIDIIDDKTNKNIYKSRVEINSYVKTTNKYYVDYLLRAKLGDDIVFEHKMNLKDKNVLITLDSRSIGDSIAWVPYVEEFRKKHDCKVFCSTFWNDLYKKEYPDIDFVKPGTPISNIYAIYTIGYWYGIERSPYDCRVVSLQENCSSILGLEHKEIRTKVTLPDRKRNIDGKYICIAPHSTAKAKYWNRKGGWQHVIDHYVNKGYKVVNISKEPNAYMGSEDLHNVIDKSGDIDIYDRMIDIKYADLFIGVGSGLSWIAWALNTTVVMISGFSAPWCEFQEGNIRIYNDNVCSGCFNDMRYEFDKGDWNWCPKFKKFECTRSITPQHVINRIETYKYNEKGIR